MSRFDKAYNSIFEGLMGCRCTCDECMDGMCSKCEYKNSGCKSEGCRCIASKEPLTKEERENKKANDYLLKRVDHS